MTSHSEKQCARCGGVFPAAQFSTDPRMTSGLSSYCKSCCRVYNRERYRIRTPEQREQKNLRRKEWYAKYRQRIKAANGLRRTERKEQIAGRPRPRRCEVCGRTSADGRGLHFDHSHTSGAFRGWLCDNCNRILGMASDRPDILRALADYLEEHAQSEVASGSSVA